MSAAAVEVFEVPRDTERILEMGGAMSVPPPSRVTFTSESDFLPALVSAGNAMRVLAAGAQELAIPGVSWGVEHFSKQKTWSRISRSAIGIGQVAASDDAVLAGMRIVAIHDKIGVKGIDENRNILPATHPKLWPLGKIPILGMCNDTLVAQGADEARLERWFMDSLIAYQSFGVSDEYFPKTYEEFRDARADLARNSRRTPSIARLEEAGVEAPHIIPDVLWRGPLKAAGNKAARFVTEGAMDPELRKALEINDPSLPAKAAHRALTLFFDWLAVSGPSPWRHHPALVREIDPTIKENSILLRLGRVGSFVVAGPTEQP